MKLIRSLWATYHYSLLPATGLTVKEVTLTIMISIVSLVGYTQDQVTEQLSSLYQAKAYDEIISGHAGKAADYPAKGIYYVGLAYHKKDDDRNCLKFMDLSIIKDGSDPEAHFIKASSHNFLGEFDQAIFSFKRAIELNSENSAYLSGLGDAFFSMKNWDMALEAYQKAVEKDNPIDRPFAMIPQIFIAKNRIDKALEASYTAKGAVAKQTSSYRILLYNIGLMELRKKDYQKARLSFLELIDLYPDDFNSYAQLVQVQYGMEEYEQAAPYKAKLYEAHRKELLPVYLKYMFCLEQFYWQGKLVQVFERFEEPEGKTFYKHIFYVCNEKNNIEFQIQTENPLGIDRLDGPNYLLGMDKNGVHSNFGLAFNQNLEYQELKSAVLNILDEKIQPMASLD